MTVRDRLRQLRQSPILRLDDPGRRETVRRVLERSQLDGALQEPSRLLAEIDLALSLTATADDGWTPVADAPAAWHRADLGATLVSGKYSVLADQSGNGLDVSQSNAGLRPTQVTRAGQLAMECDGSSRGPMVSGAATINQPLTIYGVVEPQKNGAAFPQMSAIDGRTTNRSCVFVDTTPTWDMLSTGSLQAGGTPTEAIHAFAAVFHGTTGHLYVDDFRDGHHVATGALNSSSMDGITLNAFAGISGVWQGWSWEYAIFAGNHDQDRRARFGRYATRRYTGLTVVTT